MRPIDDAAPAARAGVPPELRSELDRVYARAAQLRRRRRTVWPASMVAVFAALVTGAALLGPLGRSAAPAPAPAAGQPPATFVGVELPASGPAAAGPPSIVLVSSASGQVVRTVVARPGFVDGITRSPDGSTVFYGAGPAIYESPKDGGAVHRIATGFDPAVSPDGRSLAYLTDPSKVAGSEPELVVRDLQTGHVRQFDVIGDMGLPPVWLGDSSQIAVPVGLSGCSGNPACRGPATMRLAIVDLEAPLRSGSVLLQPTFRLFDIPGRNWKATSLFEGPQPGTALVSLPTDAPGNQAMLALLQTTASSGSRLRLTPLPGWHGSGLGPLVPPVLSVSADGRWALAATRSASTVQVVALGAAGQIVRTVPAGPSGDVIIGAAW